MPDPIVDMGGLKRNDTLSLEESIKVPAEHILS